MENEKKQSGTLKERVAIEAMDAEDAEFEATLRNFRDSVHALSDAALSRPRTVKSENRRRNWRVAASWALGCVLAVGGLSGGMLDRHHRQVEARIAAEQKAAAEQKQLEEQRAKVSDEVLLAGVDSDVSRDVPSAMEPLAQLMADDGTK